MRAYELFESEFERQSFHVWRYEPAENGEIAPVGVPPHEETLFSIGTPASYKKVGKSHWVIRPRNPLLVRADARIRVNSMTLRELCEALGVTEEQFKRIAMANVTALVQDRVTSDSQVPVEVLQMTNPGLSRLARSAGFDCIVLNLAIKVLDPTIAKMVEYVPAGGERKPTASPEPKSDDLFESENVLTAYRYETGNEGEVKPVGDGFDAFMLKPTGMPKKFISIWELRLRNPLRLTPGSAVRVGYTARQVADKLGISVEAFLEFVDLKVPLDPDVSCPPALYIYNPEFLEAARRAGFDAFIYGDFIRVFDPSVARLTFDGVKEVAPPVEEPTPKAGDLFESHSDIHLVVEQTKTSGTEFRIVLIPDEAKVVVHFTLHEKPGRITLRAKPGKGSRQGQRTLFTAQEVLESSARAAARAQQNGMRVASLDSARAVLRSAVGRGVVVRYFLDSHRFELAGVAYEEIDYFV